MPKAKEFAILLKPPTYRENGQSTVEFAVVLVVLVLLLAGPIDLYRYAFAKMTLDNATSDALSQVQASELDDASLLSSHALSSAESAYGDKIGGLAVADVSVSSSQKVSYNYRVYSSDLEKDADKFETRPSNYSYRTVSLSLSCDWSAVTIFGTMFLGADNIRIASDPITRDVFVEGYER